MVVVMEGRRGGEGGKARGFEEEEGDDEDEVVGEEEGEGGQEGGGEAAPDDGHDGEDAREGEGIVLGGWLWRWKKEKGKEGDKAGEGRRRPGHGRCEREERTRVRALARQGAAWLGAGARGRQRGQRRFGEEGAGRRGPQVRERGREIWFSKFQKRQRLNR